MKGYMSFAAYIWKIFAGVILPASVVLCNFPTTLNLQRTIPLNDRVELSKLRSHDRARHSRLLLSINGVVDFPLGGIDDPLVAGLYYTTVQLGTPAKEYSVLIDTGSDVLWVSCNGCNGCSSTTTLQNVHLNVYDPSSSSSSSIISCSDKLCTSGVQSGDSQCDMSNNSCGYQFQYGDGSTAQGYYVSDVMNLHTIVGSSQSSNNSAKVVFGCSTTVSGNFNKSAVAVAGLFGLGQKSMSVVTQLSSQGISPAAFSHCLNGNGNGGGILVLGTIVEPGIVYTPLVPSQPYYNVNLQSISVNNETLSIDPSVFATSADNGTFVDSGTTLAYLPTAAYNPFINAISAAVSQSVRPIVSNGDTCYLITSSVNNVFPQVSLNFAGGATMVLNPQDYLVELSTDAGLSLWCMGFQNIDQGLTVLGDLVLQNKVVVYDLANQQIGWVNYDCSRSVKVSTSAGSPYISVGPLRSGISRMTISYTTTTIGTVGMLALLLL